MATAPDREGGLQPHGEFSIMRLRCGVWADFLGVRHRTSRPCTAARDENHDYPS